MELGVLAVFEEYASLPLRDGLLLKFVQNSVNPLKDALGRPALARTAVTGSKLEIELDAALSAEEISISLYHEVLEAAAIAASHPPPAVCELNEAGFEEAARRMHDTLGPVTPAKLNQMLALFGF